MKMDGLKSRFLIYNYVHYMYVWIVYYCGNFFFNFRILNLVHDLDKSDTQVLSQCAYYLKRLSQFSGAAEVYEKMQDVQALVTLYVETHQWETVCVYVCVCAHVYKCVLVCVFALVHV